MNVDRLHYYMQPDGNKKFKLWNVADTRRTAFLSLDPQSERMTLEGQVEGHPITVKMNRVDISNPDKYPLANKGLHWVNPNIDNR
jgi:hypothetical protein